MLKDVVSVFKIAGVFTAVILGAGFASGQELYKFFVAYGSRSAFFGLIISGVLFGLLGYAVLDICRVKRIRSYNEFVSRVAGGFGGAVIEFFVTTFFCVLFSTMLAASGAVFKQAFGLPFYFGVILLGVFCLLTFMNGISGIVRINSALAPVMMAGGVVIGLYVLLARSYNAEVGSAGARLIGGGFSWGVLLSAVTYASYNIITAISVLASIGSLASSKRVVFWSSVFSGVSVTVLGFAMSVPLIVYQNVFRIADAEIPILKILTDYGKYIEYLYLFVLIAAIFTTAVANGFALIDWAEKKAARLPRRKSPGVTATLHIQIIITTVGVTLAQFGFSSFVGQVYPIFGYIGFFEIVLILLYWGKTKMLTGK